MKDKTNTKIGRKHKTKYNKLKQKTSRIEMLKKMKYNVKIAYNIYYCNHISKKQIEKISSLFKDYQNKIKDIILPIVENDNEEEVKNILFLYGKIETIFHTIVFLNSVENRAFILQLIEQGKEVIEEIEKEENKIPFDKI